PHNLIAISDLHLGADLKPGARRPAPAAAAIDRHLVEFFDHYATRHREGKPWRLVLDGDIVDFVAVTVTPDPGQEPFEIRAEERQFGLANEESKCIWKLRRVFERHSAIFDALARFVQAGNSVSLIRGNHDAEFSWPGVKVEFKRLLADRANLAGPARRRFERQVTFHDWFYLEPGFLYVEHGNAHDPYCMPEHFLAPCKEVRGRELGLPL